MNDLDRIREAVSGASDRFLKLLKGACAIPSVTTEGLGAPEMTDWLESWLLDLGAKVTRLTVPGAPDALLGEINYGSPRTLMIYDHYDVQPVDPIELWETPPFEPSERSGKLYARGAADNKGDLVARLCALEVYRELYGELDFNLKFFIEGEEESGSLHFEQICEEYADRLHADDCVWEGGWIDLSGNPEMYYGCKGLLYIELSYKALSGDQHSSTAVYAPSAAWRLLKALDSIQDGEGNIKVEGFYDKIVPPGPREEELLHAMPVNDEAMRRRLGVKELVGGLTGYELKRALLYNPTANIAGFQTGYTVKGGVKTVLPAEAMAKIDFRLAPDQDGGEIAELVHQHLIEHGFGDIDFRVIGHENPSRSPLDSTLGQAAEAAAARWFTRPVTIYPYMWATGPMHPIAQGLGIPICSPPGVGRTDSNLHAPNEHIHIEDFFEVIGYTVAYLREYARQPAGSPA